MGRPGSSSGSHSSGIFRLVLLKPEMKGALSHLNECKCGVTRQAGRGTGELVFYYWVSRWEFGWRREPLGLGCSQARPKRLGQGLIWKTTRIRELAPEALVLERHSLKWFLGFWGRGLYTG